MKTEFTDVSETQKTLTIEIPREIVDAEINRVAKDYSKQARLPGFRPGKVPATIIKQRFRDQIRHDVMHELIPRAVEEALQERGIEPIATPDVKDVALEEGQPLTFTAAIETIPSFDAGDLSTLEATRPSTVVADEAVEQMLQRLRERGAKYEAVEGRPIADGDTVVLDIERRDVAGGDVVSSDVAASVDRHENVSIDLGSPASPPGFDAQLVGLSSGDAKTFTVHFPAEYSVKEMANTDVSYSVKVKDVRRKVMPDLDDEFAKDMGAFDSLAVLREHVRADLRAEAEAHATRHVRTELLKQLAQRVTFDLPSSLLEREIDRRLEEFVRQLVQQKLDPREMGIDWPQFREAQREPARVAVASALALDEVARREHLTVASEDVDKELEQFAERAGLTPAALRAQLEKEGGVTRLHAELRREKAVDLALSRARITGE